MKLAYKNCGYFDDSCGEFVITQMYPKRPLINYLWNEQTVATAISSASERVCLRMKKSLARWMRANAFCI